MDAADKKLKSLIVAVETLIDFHDTYVATVEDSSGHRLDEGGSGEWTEVLNDLRGALLNLRAKE